MDFNHFIFYLHLLLYLAHVLLSIVRHGTLAIRFPLSLLLVVTGLDITNLLSPVVTKNFQTVFPQEKPTTLKTKAI